jgi:hypothetical protein
MTATNDRFDREVQLWLAAEAPSTAPRGLHEAAIGRARTSRQHPRWLLVLRGSAFDGPTGMTVRPGLRDAYVLVVLAIVLAIVVAAIAVGAFRSIPLPLGRNGVIAYSVRDSSPLFVNDHGSGTSYRIHLMAADGTDDRQVGVGSCPTFSKDGSVLAYQDASHGEGRLDITAADGTPIGFIRDVGITVFMDSEMALSPDGTRVAWLKYLQPDAPSPTELWVTPVSGGPGVRVAAASVDNTWYTLPVWSPDGRQIAFAENVRVDSPDGSNWGAYRTAIDIVGADGSDRRQLTARPGTDQVGVSWSPDGRFIAYVGLPDGSPVPSLGAAGSTAGFQPPTDIFVIDADGSADRNITNSEWAEAQPIWSPDGAHIAYQTGQDGHWAVVRMDGSTVVGAPIAGPVSAESAVWSPDGTQVLLLSVVAGSPSEDPQPITSTLLSVDAEFRGSPTTLLTVDRLITCVPTWQRLAP